MRCCVPTAIARSLPALMCAPSAGSPADEAWVRPASRSVQLRPGAAVGNVGDVHARDQLQVLHRQVAGAGVAGRAVVQLAGVLLDVVHELAEVLGRHVRMDHEDVGHLGQQRDGNEIPVHVIGLVLQHVRVHRQRADVTQDHRVTVGHGLGHFAHCRDARAAGLVLDVHTLPELLGELGRNRAGDDLAGAARRKGHDKTHRLRRPGRLRENGGCAGQCGRAGERQNLAAIECHADPLVV